MGHHEPALVRILTRFLRRHTSWRRFINPEGTQGSRGHRQAPGRLRDKWGGPQLPALWGSRLPTQRPATRAPCSPPCA